MSSFILHNNIMKEMIKINIIKVDNKKNILSYLHSLNKNNIINTKFNIICLHSYNLQFNKYFIYQSLINHHTNNYIYSHLIGITFDEKTAIHKCNQYNLIGENDFTIYMNKIINDFNLNNNKEKLYYISQKTFIDFYNIKPFEFYNLANFNKLE